MRIDIRSIREKADISIPNTESEKDILLVFPFTQSKYRNWPINNFVKFFKKIIEKKDCNIIVVGENFNINKFNYEHKNITYQFSLDSLEDLVHLISQSRLIISSDSGPIHLANALGKKVLGLYSVVPTCFTGPFGQEHNCIDHYSNFQKVTYPYKRIYSFKAMQSITVEEVYSKFLTLW